MKIVSGTSRSERTLASFVLPESGLPPRLEWAGCGAARLNETARTSRHTGIARYSRKVSPARLVSPPWLKSSDRSLIDRILHRQISAPSPPSAPRSFRQRGSGAVWLGRRYVFACSRASSCAWISAASSPSAGRSGSGGTSPPQAAITSSGVIAPGRSPRAMRLAEVV